jgi:acyl carrier protein phosphodiesterase
MNYLAHAYLSFEITDITVGNMISDFVKGKKKLDYPVAIQHGITLHRAIDSFTDSHTVTRQAKSFFKEAYGLYAGPLVDVVYDHFLANDPLRFPEMGKEDPAGSGLKAFAQKTYEQLGTRQALMPERFGRLFHYMQAQDWLFNYRYKEGIFNAFAGLARRAAYMGSPEQADLLFEQYYTGLEACYTDFFPALQDFALRTLQQLQEAKG